MEENVSQCLAGNEASGEDICEAEGSSIVITQQEQELLAAQVPNMERKRRLICDVCGKSFSFKSQMSRHSTVHTNERPYNCSKCGKRYKRQDARRRHELRHKRDQKVKGSNRRGSLDIPSSGSAKPSSRKGNASYGCVNESRQYACSICEKYYYSSSNLKTHMRFHTNERPLNCHICQKSFKWSASLTHHLSTHSSEKPFPCSFCEKKFKTKLAKSEHELLHF